jgi:hypothetical protein
MRRRVIIVAGLCCVVIAFIHVAFSYPWIIYPTKSSPNKLFIVCHSGLFYPNKPVITLKHYINNLHVCDNILVIKNGVHVQEPQSYDLPNLDNGRVEVTVELGDKMNSSFTLNYDNANDLYQRGLLIYLADYNDNGNQYVYFVSGKETTCYNRTKDSSEWTIKAEVPSPKAIPHKEYFAYSVGYSGWKENKWVVNDSSSEPS